MASNNVVNTYVIWPVLIDMIVARMMGPVASMLNSYPNPGNKPAACKRAAITPNKLPRTSFMVLE